MTDILKLSFIAKLTHKTDLITEVIFLGETMKLKKKYLLIDNMMINVCRTSFTIHKPK